MINEERSVQKYIPKEEQYIDWQDAEYHNLDAFSLRLSKAFYVVLLIWLTTASLMKNFFSVKLNEYINCGFTNLVLGFPEVRGDVSWSSCCIWF